MKTEKKKRGGKVFKWIGLGFLVFIAVVMVYAILGKEQTLSLQIDSVDLSDIPDGEYTGTYDCYRWSNTVIVSVAEHQITGIAVVKSPSGRDSIRQDLTERILFAQSPEVDAVSGATADSKAFLEAVENALINAVPSS